MLWKEHFCYLGQVDRWYCEVRGTGNKTWVCAGTQDTELMPNRKKLVSPILLETKT